MVNEPTKKKAKNNKLDTICNKVQQIYYGL